jgi:hypothetical protein
VQAPYGKGEETLVDTSVRRVWRLTPDRFKLTNPEWQKFLKQTVKHVQQVLGLDRQKLESHLYDLLLYEPGSFFLPHKDGEKLDRMVATLVVVLPSSFAGGELVVRHEGQEEVIDFGGEQSAFQIHFAAFYADCEHEIRPLRAGYRVCLVYNLTLAKSKKPLTAPRATEHIEKISEILRQWAVEATGKLAILLEHEYTQDGLTWDALKGVDRAKAGILAAAARQAGCKAYLALLTLHEAGSAEGGDYGYGYRRRRWYGAQKEEAQAGQYTMGEIYDSDLSAAQWSDSEGHGLPIGELAVNEDELLDPDALGGVDPEEQFEGYTGNAGMTLDHWYRHAAIFLWPESLHFKILCDSGAQQVVPVLKDMVAQWKKAGRSEGAELKQQCIALAAAMLARWPERHHAGYYPAKDTETGDLLKTLAALDDVGLIRTYVGEVLAKDDGLEPGPALVTVCQEHGWAAFQKELSAVCKSTTPHSLPRNVRILEQLGTAKVRQKDGWSELCGRLGEELLAALERIDAAPATDWQARGVPRLEVLTALTKALVGAERSELLSCLVNHALATPMQYPLDATLLPALLGLGPWLEEHLAQPSDAVSRWLAACREQLEALTVKKPQMPTDCRRDVHVSHDCADCRELKHFLQDPNESVHRFTAAQDRRSHLEHMIQQYGIDLDCKTEQRGRPYTLVCTKNTKSYHAKLKKYHQDLEHRATIRALEKALPG